MASVISTLAVRLTADARQFSTVMGQATKTVAGMSSGVEQAAERAGKAMTLRLTLPLALSGAAAVKWSLDLEHTFAKVEALVGASEKDMALYRGAITGHLEGISGAAAKTASDVYSSFKSIPISSQELAEGLYFVASSGFAGADALRVLESSAQAAAVGLGETQAVARVVGAAVNAFSDQELTAAHATDVLVAAVREGTAEASEMAATLGGVIPLAAQLHVSFDEAAASVAAMTLSGRTAGEAVTSTAQIFQAVLNPTDQAEKALAKYGLTAEWLREGIERDFLGTLRELKDRFGDNEQAIAELIGRREGFIGFLNLTGANAKKVDNVFHSIVGTSGDLSAALKTMQEDPLYQVQLAFKNVREAAIEFGAILTPIAVVAAGAVSFLANAFRALPQPIKIGITVVLGLLAVIGPLLYVGAKLLKLYSLWRIAGLAQAAVHWTLAQAQAANTASTVAQAAADQAQAIATAESAAAMAGDATTTSANTAQTWANTLATQANAAAQKAQALNTIVSQKAMWGWGKSLKWAATGAWGLAKAAGSLATRFSPLIAGALVWGKALADGNKNFAAQQKATEAALTTVNRYGRALNTGRISVDTFRAKVIEAAEGGASFGDVTARGNEILEGFAGGVDLASAALRDAGYRAGQSKKEWEAMQYAQEKAKWEASDMGKALMEQGLAFDDLNPKIEKSAEEMIYWARMTEKEFGEWQSGVRESLSSLSGVFSEFDAEAGMDQLLSSLAKRLAAVRSYHDNMRQLVERGVPQEVLVEIENIAATDAGAAAHLAGQLAQASEEEYKQFLKNADLIQGVGRRHMSFMGNYVEEQREIVRRQRETAQIAGKTRPVLAVLGVDQGAQRRVADTLARAFTAEDFGDLGRQSIEAYAAGLSERLHVPANKIEQTIGFMVSEMDEGRDLIAAKARRLRTALDGMFGDSPQAAAHYFREGMDLIKGEVARSKGIGESLAIASALSPEDARLATGVVGIVRGAIEDGKIEAEHAVLIGRDISRWIEKGVKPERLTEKVRASIKDIISAQRKVTTGLQKEILAPAGREPLSWLLGAHDKWERLHSDVTTVERRSHRVTSVLSEDFPQAIRRGVNPLIDAMISTADETEVARGQIRDLHGALNDLSGADAKVGVDVIFNLGALGAGGKQDGIDSLTGLQKALGGGLGGSVVPIGMKLQSMGFLVSEHPAFGGVAPVHTTNSYHYAAQGFRAIDVNWPGPDEPAMLDSIYQWLAALNPIELLWRTKGHQKHLHVAFDEGGWLKEPVIGRGKVSGATYSFAETGPEAFAGSGKRPPWMADAPSGGGGDRTVTLVDAQIEITNWDKGIGRIEGKLISSEHDGRKQRQRVRGMNR